MEKTHPLNISMQVCSQDVKKDIFVVRDNNKELFRPKDPYISLCNWYTYVANNNTRPNIAFSLKFLS